MSVENIPWLNEEFVPTIDPDDLKALWDLCEDIERRRALHAGTNDLTVLYGLDIPVGFAFFRRVLNRAQTSTVSRDNAHPRLA
jgi:hypothetical protein